MEIATIGFTQSSAEHFFERLRKAGVKRLLDVRRNNVSQLAGFAKAKDLAYFCREILSVRYDHDVRLAPTQELLDAYRKEKLPWSWYEQRFLQLMADRKLPAEIERDPFERYKTALLCSEPTAERCHRRLVVELMAEKWDAKVEHL